MYGILSAFIYAYLKKFLLPDPLHLRPYTLNWIQMRWRGRHKQELDTFSLQKGYSRPIFVSLMIISHYDSIFP